MTNVFPHHLVEALHHRNYEAVYNIIGDRRTLDFTLRDGFGANILHHAAWSHPLILQLIIDSSMPLYTEDQFHAHINAQDFYGKTPLHNAIYQGVQRGVVFLLASGANINIQTAMGQSPLILAISRGLNSIAQLLIMDSDINLGLVDNTARTAYDIAVHLGNTHITELLSLRLGYRFQRPPVEHGFSTPERRPRGGTVVTTPPYMPARIPQAATTTASRVSRPILGAFTELVVSGQAPRLPMPPMPEAELILGLDSTESQNSRLVRGSSMDGSYFNPASASL